MADRKFSELPLAGSIVGDEDLVALKPSGSQSDLENVLIPLNDLATFILSQDSDTGGVVGGASESITISGTSANLDNDNKSKYHRFTNAAAKTLTVQPNATEALDQDGEWHIRNVGAADLTIIEGSGVTINLPAGGTLVVPQGGTVTLKRVAEDELDLFGQVAAAA